MESNRFRDLLALSIQGDAYAIQLLLDAYEPLVRKASTVNGHFDEDCRQFILLRILLAIPKFAPNYSKI